MEKLQKIFCHIHFYLLEINTFFYSMEYEIKNQFDQTFDQRS